MAFFPYIKASLRKNKYYLDDRYAIDDGNDHPFVVLLPGGGYSIIYSYGEGDPIAKELNNKGISAFILYYRVKKKAHYPNPLDDCASAIKHILDNAQNYHVMKDNYSLWGASAGGHLAASMGTDHVGCNIYNLPYPKSLVLIYPVITFVKEYHRGSRRLFLGRKVCDECVYKYSVENHVHDKYPETFIWCGDHDKSVPCSNSVLMSNALKEKNIRYELKIYPNIGHGVGLAKGTTAESWFNDAVKFCFGIE